MSLAGVIAVATAGLLMTATPATASTSAGTPGVPKNLYLSLGDSQGSGLQVDRFIAMLIAGTYRPDAFNTGYTDDFHALMLAQRPQQQVVNYSCPATTTDGMLAPDGCFFPDAGLALHDAFTGAQLDAAVAFLRAHPGQVSPITVSIGGGDIRATIEGCHGAQHCIITSGLSAHLTANLTTILSRLRAAAPTADVLLLLPRDADLLAYPKDDALWGGFVQDMRAVAQAQGVGVADSYTAITLAGRTCELTFLCASGDAHPNDLGYGVIAQLFFQAAGYKASA